MVGLTIVITILHQIDNPSHFVPCVQVLLNPLIYISPDELSFNNNFL